MTRPGARYGTGGRVPTYIGGASPIGTYERKWQYVQERREGISNTRWEREGQPLYINMDAGPQRIGYVWQVLPECITKPVLSLAGVFRSTTKRLTYRFADMHSFVRTQSASSSEETLQLDHRF